MKDFAKRLNRVMIEARISTTELAKAMGVTHSIISHYLHGRKSPSVSSLLLLASCLGCDPAYLLCGDENSASEFKVAPRPIVSTVKPMLAFTVEDVFNWSDIQREFNMQVKKGRTPEEAAGNRKLLYCENPRLHNCIPVVMDNDSMVSQNGLPYTFSEDMVVFADPTLADKAKHGSFVVALAGEKKRGVIRRLIQDGDKLFLQPLNDRYNQIEVSEDAVIILGVVVHASFDVAI